MSDSGQHDHPESGDTWVGDTRLLSPAEFALLAGLLVLLGAIFFFDVSFLRDSIVPGSIYALPILIAAYFFRVRFVGAIAVLAFTLELAGVLQQGPLPWAWYLALLAPVFVFVLAAAVARRMQRERTLLEQVSEGRSQAEQLAAERQQLLEQVQAQNEELQALSEELQQQNEEIQSQNEELRGANDSLVVAERGVSEANARLQVSNEALRESEERYHSLFENMTEAFALHEIITDGSGRPVDYRFLDLNPSFERITGLKRAETVGRRVLEVLPNIEPYWIETYGKVVQTGEPVHFENYAGPLDRWYEVFAYRPAPAQFAVIFLDVTERKQAEEERERLLAAVQQEKDRLSTLISSMTDEVWLADTDKKFTLANPSALQEFGLGSAAGGIGVEKLAASLEVLRPDGSPRPVEEAPALRALQGEVVRNQEEIIRTPATGKLRYRQVSAAPMRDAKGTIIGSVSVVRDITERTEAEEERERLLQQIQSQNEALRKLAEVAERRAEELDTVVESIADPLFVFDADGRIVSANSSGLALIDKESGQDLGTIADYARTLSLSFLDGRAMQAEDLAASRAIRNGEVTRGSDEVGTHPKTHQPLSLFVSAAPLHDKEGRVVGAVEVVANITELRHLEKLRDEFLSMAAHELKTPVTGIKGYTQLMLRRGATGIDPSDRRILETIDRQCNRLDRLVQELLDVSRLRKGQLELHKEKVVVSDFLVETVRQLAVLSAKHEVRCDNCEEAKVLVEADRDRLEQVLTNLVTNAIRYSAGGEIEVAARVGDGRVIVSVRDQGIGIPSDKQGRVFEYFYRAHVGTQYDLGGMGVGLYISREIILRHGGEMWFESEEGKGSTFYFSLPVVGD
jgi:two-component system, OmpR family, phosphate regulon sensor histidine kinase PhoR